MGVGAGAETAPRRDERLGVGRERRKQEGGESIKEEGALESVRKAEVIVSGGG